MHDSVRRSKATAIAIVGVPKISESNGRTDHLIKFVDRCLLRRLYTERVPSYRYVVVIWRRFVFRK